MHHSGDDDLQCQETAFSHGGILKVKKMQFQRDHSPSFSSRYRA